MLKLFQQLADNPYVHLFSGIILVLTAVAEIISSIEEGLIGAHHGVAVFGMVQILKTLPHLHHGAECVTKFKD